MNSEIQKGPEQFGHESDAEGAEDKKNEKASDLEVDEGGKESGYDKSAEIGEQAWQAVTTKAKSLGDRFKRGWGNLKRAVRKDAMATLGDAIRGYRKTRDIGKKGVEIAGDAARTGAGLGLLGIEAGAKFLSRETSGETWSKRAKELGNFVSSQWEKSPTRKALVATKEAAIDTYESAMDWKKQQADAVMARYYETSDAVYGWIEDKTAPRVEAAQEVENDASELSLDLGKRDYSKIKDKKLAKRAQATMARADKVAAKAKKRGGRWGKLLSFATRKRQQINTAKEERFATETAGA